jgi:MFS family permease
LGSTAFFLCAQVLPAFAAPVAVSRLDRRPPRRVLPTLYATEAVLFGVLAWMTTRFSLVPVLTLALLDGIVAIVSRSLARTATVEVLTGSDLLHDGNAVTNGAFAICFMAGPAIGGVVVAAGGTAAALLANCALFAGIAVLLALTVLPSPAFQAGSSSGRLRAGLDHVRRSPALRTLLSLQTVGMVFFTISVPVEVVFAQRTLHVGAAGYGAMVSAWGFGTVVGSAAYARWRRASARVLIAASAAALGVGLTVMAVAPSIEVAVIGAALGGMSNGVEMVAAQTAVQLRTPPAWMALVMSLNQAVWQATPGLGILLGGTIATLADPRVAFGVAAVGSFAFTVVAWVALAPSRFAPPPTAEERRAARAGGLADSEADRSAAPAREKIA